MSYEDDDAARRALRELLRRERRDRFKVKDVDDLKVLEGVFDSRTLMTLYELMNRGYLSSLKGAVKSGKEARIYWGVGSGGEDVAVKIYYTVNSQFRRRIMYMEGDPRFESLKRTPWGLTEVWAKKEFANLKQALEAGVRVPRPIAVRRNVLLMEFIGEAGVPAPLLAESDVGSDDYSIIIHYIKELWRRAAIVHADLSEYNAFKWGGEIVLFDFGSSVDVSHPSAYELLRRDVDNVNRFFSSRGVEVRPAHEVLEEVIGG